MRAQFSGYLPAGESLVSVYLAVQDMQLKPHSADGGSGEAAFPVVCQRQVQSSYVSVHVHLSQSVDLDYLSSLSVSFASLCICRSVCLSVIVHV